MIDWHMYLMSYQICCVATSITFYESLSICLRMCFLKINYYTKEKKELLYFSENKLKDMVDPLHH